MYLRTTCKNVALHVGWINGLPKIRANVENFSAGVPTMFFQRTFVTAR